MSPSERTAIRVLFDLEREARQCRYEKAGLPFGSGRGFELWIAFEQETTLN